MKCIMKEYLENNSSMNIKISNYFILVNFLVRENCMPTKPVLESIISDALFKCILSSSRSKLFSQYPHLTKY